MQFLAAKQVDCSSKQSNRCVLRVVLVAVVIVDVLAHVDSCNEALPTSKLFAGRPFWVVYKIMTSFACMIAVVEIYFTNKLCCCVLIQKFLSSGPPVFMCDTLHRGTGSVAKCQGEESLVT